MRALLPMFVIAFASFTANAGSLDLYQATKVDCSQGQVNQAKAAQIIGGKAVGRFIEDGQSRGATIVETDGSIVSISKDSGNSSGLCQNDGVETLTISTYVKTKPSTSNPCEGKKQGDRCGEPRYNGAYSTWEYGSCLSGPPVGELLCEYGG